MTLREYYVERLRAERPAFLAVLKAIPPEKAPYKPHDRSPSAGQLVCATVVLALFTPFVHAPSTDIGLKGIGSLLALGVLGSGIAYVLNYSIVRAAGSAVGSMVTYLVPVFSTVLGALVLGEPLRWNQPVGAVVLITGIAVSQGLIAGRRSRLGVSQPSPGVADGDVRADESGSRSRSRHPVGTHRDSAG